MPDKPLAEVFHVNSKRDRQLNRFIGLIDVGLFVKVDKSAEQESSVSSQIASMGVRFHGCH